MSSMKCIHMFANCVYMCVHACARACMRVITDLIVASSFRNCCISVKLTLLHAVVVSTATARFAAASGRHIHIDHALGISRQRVLYVNGVHESWLSLSLYTPPRMAGRFCV